MEAIARFGSFATALVVKIQGLVPIRGRRKRADSCHSRVGREGQDSAQRRHRLSLSHKRIPQGLRLGRAGLSGGGEAETRRAPQNLFGAQENRGVDHSAVDCGCAEDAPRA